MPSRAVRKHQAAKRKAEQAGTDVGTEPPAPAPSAQPSGSGLPRPAKRIIDEVLDGPSVVDRKREAAKRARQRELEQQQQAHQAWLDNRGRVLRRQVSTEAEVKRRRTDTYVLGRVALYDAISTRFASGGFASSWG